LNNFTALQKAMGLARPGNNRTPNLQYKPESGAMVNVSTGPNGEIIEKPFKEAALFNPDPKANLSPDQRITKILPPGGGRNYPVGSQEYKRFQDTRYSVDLFNQSVGAMLNAVYTGKIDEQTLFADTSIGRRLREMTNTDPLDAMAAREQLNQGSLSAIQHVRTITGGRPAAGFINDLESLLTAKGATAEEKFAAQITQKYTLEMALASMAGSAENDRLFSDPKFYDYMQKKSAALYKVTKDKRYRGGAPSLQQIVNDYKQTQSTTAPQIAPRENYKNRIPGMK
jgi:hypothetical protein